mgnify:CR=1 FL=1
MYYNKNKKKNKGGAIMEKVEPIRDKDKIELMKSDLLKQGYRNYMMFILGINTGLRIGDLLKLKVNDVKERTHIVLREQKSGKAKRFMINDRLKQEIDKYIQGMADDDYLFQSQKGDNRPISRVQAYRILNGAAERIGLESIGTHTLRKTFGYWHYQQYKDVALLQDLFNHSAPSITLRYIGINQDAMDKTIEDFYL